MSLSILRHAHRTKYTVLSNETIRDPRLSFRATGLLAYLVSLPDGAEVDSLSLSRRKSEGRDAIRTAFVELVAAGYVRRYREQDQATGRWAMVTEVSDLPETAFQAPGDGGLETRPTVSQAIKALEVPAAESNENPMRPDGRFDQFWAAYPQRNGRKVGKKAAVERWRRLSSEHQEEALTAVKEYARAVAQSDTIPRDAERFLQGQWWQDWLGAPEAAPSPYAARPPCGTCEGDGWILKDGADGAFPCPECRGVASRR